MAISNLRSAKCVNDLSRTRPLPSHRSSVPSKGASAQTRNLWRCSHQRYGSINEHAQPRMEKCHRLFPSKFRSRTTRLPRRPQTISDHEHHHTPWWNQGWGWGRFKPSFPRFPNGRPPEGDFWEAERARTQERMEQIKKAIDADPYGALFGRRLDPWGSLDKMENSLSSLYRSVFGDDKTGDPKSMNTTARVSATETSSTQKQKSSVKATEGNVSNISKDTSRGDLEFDPISGRMGPRKAVSPDVTEHDVLSKDASERPREDSKLDSKRVGYLSAVQEPHADAETPVDNDLDAKLDQREEDTTKQSPQVIHEDGELGTVDAEGSHHSSQKMNDSVDETSPELANERSSKMNTNGMLQSRDEVPSPKTKHEPFKVEIQEPHKSTPADVNTNGYNAGERFGPSGFIAQVDQKPATSSFSDTFQSEPILSQEKAEDLDLLSASDIRTPYYSRVSERNNSQRRTGQKELDTFFDSHTDPAGDLDAQAIRHKFQDYETSKSPSEAPSFTPTSQSTLDTSKDQIVSEGRIHDVAPEPSQSTEQDNDAHKPSPSAASPPEIYQVLAYDPSTYKMSQAETSSSMSTTNEPLHPTEVLSLLNNPAKFMPYISKMHADGYEIVSGSGDVLVFRKELQPSHGHSSSPPGPESIDAGIRNEPLFRESALEHPTPVPREGTTKIDSPAAPSPDLSSPVEKSPVGSQGSSKSNSKAGGPIRRMFIGGIAIAATCYAIGVVGEYFRTGGQDGRGIDGFTAFESERRQREREENAIVPRV